MSHPTPYPLSPTLCLELNQGNVWAVRIDCRNELEAHRIYKWAVSQSALVTLQPHDQGWWVRCWGLNPRAWKTVLSPQAS
ncbi:hypothetical protein [Synechococcus sp. PCC 6312]|uniref:hypothetical protein n=1 Tax=Synechococcus sp. (strain ATCC 27167 / PCC 6312) TaxID=195253 RepID=UPI00029F0621|nr:hypothetical protein [Synechococcus sp. PCC 6312]AFY61861.1 hypothetical protein Syn6312_2781 [Synechococcus sp. PCC 6312]